MAAADARAAGDGRKRRAPCECEQPAAVDMLSALPDALLLHILSFLPVEDVIPTALLSRRWRNLWKSTPCLDFCRYSSLPSHYRPHYYCRHTWYWLRNDYYPPDSIDRALALHEGTKVRTFRAAVREPSRGKKYKIEELMEMVDSWVLFALESQVEELELDCLEIESQDYMLPDCVFTCKSLVSLALEFCRFYLPPQILMSSLKTLALSYVEIYHGELKDLVAGCPSLECLSLHGYDPSFYDGICAVCLKTLNICDDCDIEIDHEYDYKVHISAPSMTTLVLDGYLRPYHDMNMKDSSSIVTASLDFTYMFIYETGFDDYECLADLLRGLRHVQVLRLCHWCVQALSVRPSECSRFLSEFSIIRLELSVGFITYEFPGIFNILRSFTKLEFLAIDITCESERITIMDDTLEGYVDETKYAMSDERSSPAMLQNLKAVSVSGLVGSICAEKEDKTVEETLKLEKYQNGIEFFQFLLENSPVLGRLMINTTSKVNKLTNKNLEILSGFTSRLLALSRASPNALVVIQDL